MQVEQILRQGTVQDVQTLIDSGIDLASFRSEGGYDALLTTMFGSGRVADSNLIPLIRLLVAGGAPLNGESAYRESALSLLSHAGRFDAVEVLLEAGGDERLVSWTPLARAVALGNLEKLQELLPDAQAELETQDRWWRTPFLIALAAGREDFASLLAAAGANQDAVDHVGRSAIFHAVASHRLDTVRWLLERGVDVDTVDEGGSTALGEAVEGDDFAMVDLLLTAGADPDHHQVGFSALASARSRAVANRLLEAGADPKELTDGVQRLFTGKPPLSEAEAFVGLTSDDFDRDRTRRFGVANPEPMSVPFWVAMVRSGLGGYFAAEHFQAETFDPDRPVWCAKRFGQSMTLLLDGRVVQVAGEHEDGYDPDFCIYNDVFVHYPSGSIEIFGYPKDVFPPTDFHSATLVDDTIVLIGSLGYRNERAHGTTPVYALDTHTWRIERLATSGSMPGWIYKHRAHHSGDRKIIVSGGEVLTLVDGKEHTEPNRHAFVFDIRRLTWSRA